jgi:hypothetical protein
VEAPRRRGTAAVDVARAYLREIGKASRRSTLTPDEAMELCDRLDVTGHSGYSVPEHADALCCAEA